MTKHKKIVLDDESITSLQKVADVALAIAATAGVIGIALLAPNALLAVDKFFLRKGKGRLNTAQKQEKIKRAFYYLRERGYVSFGDEDDVVALTVRGQDRLGGLLAPQAAIEKPVQWNNRWWLVAADIPTEQFRPAADAFRRRLRQYNFYLLQRSLWLYPYNPSVAVASVVRSLGIQHYVTIMEINTLDHEDEMKSKKHFQDSKIL